MTEANRNAAPDLTKQTLRHPRQAKWREANPQAAWAHVAFNAALRKGLVERQPCEVCGATDAEGHHDDYDRPLDVTWLCRAHHKALHAEQRRAKR